MFAPQLCWSHVRKSLKTEWLLSEPRFKHLVSNESNFVLLTTPHVLQVVLRGTQTSEIPTIGDRICSRAWCVWFFVDVVEWLKPHLLCISYVFATLSLILPEKYFCLRSEPIIHVQPPLLGKDSFLDLPPPSLFTNTNLMFHGSQMKRACRRSLCCTHFCQYGRQKRLLSWGDKCLRFVCINIYSLCMRCAIYICTHCVYIYPIYIYSTDMRGYTPLDNLSLCVYTLNIYYTLSSDYTHIYNNIKHAIKCKLYSCMFCVLLYVIENIHCYT